MFDLDSGDKGHFPHLLNGPKWVNFENPQPYLEDGQRFPPKHYFGVEGMRPKGKKAFEEWYEEEAAKYRADPAKLYWPVHELRRYCQQDTRILALGFQKFRNEWLSQFADMDPVDYITFPQYNNSLLRNKYMEKDSLALLPPQGFEVLNNRNSRQCYAWLHCVKADLKEEGAEVVEERTGRKGSEVLISGLKVDGFFKDSLGRQHVLQYHGCHWHGCPQCTQDPSHESQLKYRDTLESSQRLRDLSTNLISPYGTFVYHEMWEHDFNTWSKKGHRHAERIRTFKKLWDKDALSPRDAYFGGRTNAIHHSVNKVPEGWQLVYVDFTSLYPAVMSGTDGQLWPVGFPNIYTGVEVVEDAPKLEESFGLWKVKVHPPKDLRHPVLPQRFNGKLIFALCRTCAETERQNDCPHSKEGRAIDGTFFTEELKKAVQKGYQLDTPTEVWDWPPEQRSEDMFKPMMRDQYKKKVVSSPFNSEQEILGAMAELGDMGIPVERGEFQENPSRRSLAKFALNNVWGFLGKRSNPSSSDFITSAKELWDLEDDPDKEVVGIFDTAVQDMVEVTWHQKKERAGKKGSIVCSLMTTAYGRLKLYDLLDDFSDEVLYFDTDSAFLLLPPGKAGPPTSTRLGELKDEILDAFGPGAYIISFHSSGPKSYTYTVVNGEGRVVGRPMKTKGISTTVEALETVNPKAMEAVVADRDKVLRVPQRRIARCLRRGMLYDVKSAKRFAFSSTKRRLLTDSATLDTLPFGYVLHTRSQKLDDLIHLLGQDLE